MPVGTDKPDIDLVVRTAIRDATTTQDAVSALVHRARRDIVFRDAIITAAFGNVYERAAERLVRERLQTARASARAAATKVRKARQTDAEVEELLEHVSTAVLNIRRWTLPNGNLLLRADGAEVREAAQATWQEIAGLQTNAKFYEAVSQRVGVGQIVGEVLSEREIVDLLAKAT